MTSEIALAGSFNTRDLGGYPCATGVTASGRIYRSGNLAQLDGQGLAQLRALKVSRVIDLRSAKERAAEPDPFGGESGIELLSFSLFDDLDPQNLSGDDTLLVMYLRALQNQGAVFVEVMQGILSSPDAVIFHCTAGKDRTGLVAALLLSVAGVARDDIIADYALTAKNLGPLIARLEELSASVGMDAAKVAPMLACKPETMAKALDWLEDNWQDGANYLLNHGLSEAELQQLRAQLTGQ